MTKIKSSFVVVPLFIEPAQFIVESIDTSLNIYTQQHLQLIAFCRWSFMRNCF